MEGRVFTVVGRGNVVMVCDSKTMKATYKEYSGVTIGSLIAIKSVLTKIANTPVKDRVDQYTILVPDCVRGLHSPGTVNHWLQHRTSKKGTQLSMEFIGLISDITSLMNELENTKILCASIMKRGFYANQVRKAWKTMESIVPKEKTIRMAK